MALRPSEATIISAIMQALLYGLSLPMFFMTLCILLRNRFRRRPNYVMLGTACILELLALAELIIKTMRIWQGLVTVGPSLPGGPDLYFMNVTHYTLITNGCLHGVQTLILDAVVIYRTYIVWNSIHPVIIPILGWFGLLAASTGTNISLSTAHKTENDIFGGAADKWLTAVYSLTLATNLSASVLLAYRVWKVDQSVAEYREGRRLMPVVRAIVESGALYSVTVAVALILFVLDSVGVYIVLAMISPIICIVFNMIIIRTAFAIDMWPSISGGNTQCNPTVDLGRNGPGSRRAGRRHVRAYDSGGFELGSMAVEITRYTGTDGETSSDVDRKASGRLEDDNAGVHLTSKPPPNDTAAV